MGQSKHLRVYTILESGRNYSQGFITFSLPQFCVSYQFVNLYLKYFSTEFQVHKFTNWLSPFTNSFFVLCSKLPTVERLLASWTFCTLTQHYVSLPANYNHKHSDLPAGFTSEKKVPTFFPSTISVMTWPEILGWVPLAITTEVPPWRAHKAAFT